MFNDDKICFFLSNSTFLPMRSDKELDTKASKKATTITMTDA